MANMPNTLPSITPQVDGVDDVDAADVNLVADEVTATAAHLGVNNSVVTSSIDYKLKNAASIDPGHRHTLSALSLSGLTVGHALFASSATACAFRAIQEADVVNGGILARVTDAETISGLWTFNGASKPRFHQGIDLRAAGSESVSHVAAAGAGTVTYSWPSTFSNGQFLQVGAGGALTWAAASGGGGGWTDDGGVVRLATAGDQVGIGTASPIAGVRLQVTGQADADVLLTLNSTATATGAALQALRNGTLNAEITASGTFRTKNTQVLQIAASASATMLSATTGAWFGINLDVEGSIFSGAHLALMVHPNRNSLIGDLNGFSQSDIGAQFGVLNAIAAQPALRVRAHASQSANILEVQNSAGSTTYLSISSAGALATRAITTAAGFGLTLAGASSGSVALLAPASGATVTLTLPGNLGSAGQVLTTDGSGVLTWQAGGAGSSALHAITAAATTNTIANGANTQTWQWTPNASSVAGLVLEATGGAVASGQRLLVLDRNANFRVTALAIMSDAPVQDSGSNPLFYVDTQSAVAIQGNPKFRIDSCGMTFSFAPLPECWDNAINHALMGVCQLHYLSDVASVADTAKNYSTLGAQMDHTGSHHVHYSGSLRAVLGIARNFVKLNGGTGSVANMVGGDFEVHQVNTYDGPVTVGACLRVRLVGAADANVFANGYGLLLQAPSDANGSYTTKWGIRQLGSEQNALGGALTVGSTAAPAASASIDLTSATKALLLNRMAGTGGVATPVDGMIVYDSTAGDFKGRKGGAWTVLGGSSGTPALSAIIAATASNTIANADFQQTWQWALDTGNQIGMMLEATGQHASASGQRLMLLDRNANTQITPLAIMADAPHADSGARPLFHVDTQSSVAINGFCNFRVDGAGMIFGAALNATNWDNAINDALLGVAELALHSFASSSGTTSKNYSTIAAKMEPTSASLTMNGTQRAIHALMRSGVTAGAIAEMIGVDVNIIQVNTKNAPIALAAGLRTRLEVNSTSGIIVDGVGLLLQAPVENGTGTITNKYGIQQLGGEANALGGGLTVGRTTKHGAMDGTVPGGQRVKFAVFAGGVEQFAVEEDGDLRINNAVAETNNVPAASLYKVPIRDNGGNLLGYVPVYADW